MELRALNSCFNKLTTANPLSKNRSPPAFPRKLGCAAKDASTHHFKTWLPLALRRRGVSGATHQMIHLFSVVLVGLSCSCC
jgi:hypothetical protein